MPTLAYLKDRWFIPMDGTAPDSVPCRRHTPAPTSYDLAVSTDGNSIELLIDGKNFMKAWHDEVKALHGIQGTELYLAAWRLEGVNTLGSSDGKSDALELLNEADENGVDVRVLLSDHLTCLLFNRPAAIWLLGHGIKNILDNRYPVAGSNHFKLTIFKRPNKTSALLGSIDISRSRWDDSQHLPKNRERPPLFGQPTHDIGIMINGPAVKDLELLFRERWNDPGYQFIFPSISTPVTSPSPTQGSLSIQILRTYGIAQLLGYTWSTRGEFTIWAAYLNAIKKASKYIYIEDQYFLPFDWPPAFRKSGLACDTDLVFQLGEAIKRGVKVFVLTPSNAEDFGKGKIKYQRDVGINYLKEIKNAEKVKNAEATGDVLVASLSNGSTDIYVHSKLMIVDDELVIIGSANFGQRSMSCDGEVQLAIVDANNTFAKELRIELWSEHLKIATDLNNPIDAFLKMVDGVSNKIGHLIPYPLDEKAVYVYPMSNDNDSTPPEKGHSLFMQNIFDPYYGPKNIRFGDSS